MGPSASYLDDNEERHMRLSERVKAAAATNLQKAVDVSGSHTYMPLQQADAAFDEGLAFVSRLL